MGLLGKGVHLKFSFFICVLISIISCGGGGGDSDDSTGPTVSITENKRPFANTGEDITVDEQSEVLLDGTASTDVDGSILQYRWRQIGGPSVEINNNTSSGISFVAPVTTAQVDLVFELSVADNDGATDSDTVTVFVQPVNENPTANAGEDFLVTEQTLVNLSSQSSDKDGEIIEYLWRQVSGPTVELAENALATIQFQSPIVTSKAVLEFELDVKDNEGGNSTDNVSITVVAVNSEPLAHAGDSIVANEQTQITLTGEASTDTDGDIIQYHWLQLKGPTVTLQGDQSVNSSFLAPTTTAEIHYEFELTVTDNEGAIAKDTVSVTVLPVTEAPTVGLNEELEIVEKSVVVLEGTAIDTDGEITSYHWIQTAGELWPIADRSAAQIELIAPDVNERSVYEFELIATDNEMREARGTFKITVTPEFQAKTLFPPEDTAFIGDSTELTGLVENYEGPLDAVTISVKSGSSVLQPSLGENNTWRLSDVPLEPINGIATIEVSAVDQAGNESSYQISVDTQPSIFDGQGLIHDAQRNKLYTYSNSQRAFVSIDTDTGLRTLVSSPEVRDGFGFPSFVKDIDGYFDPDNPANSKLYILGLYNVYEAEIETGNRRFLPYSFSNADALATDFDTDSLFVVDDNVVLRLNISAETSAILASPEVGTGPMITNAAFMEYDPLTNALYIADSELSALVKIDLDSLERSIVVDANNNLGLIFGYTEYQTAIDSQNSELYVTEFGSIFKINLAEDSISVPFALNEVIGSSNTELKGLTLSQNEDSLFMMNSGSGQRVISYSQPTDENRNILSIAYGSGSPYRSVYDMQYDAKNKQLILSHPYSSDDNDLPGFSMVNPETGVRSPFGFNIQNQVLDFSATENVLTYYTGGGLFKYDAYTDENSMISGLRRGDGPSLGFGVGFEIDEKSNTAFWFNERNILSIDLTTGHRESVFDYHTNLFLHGYDAQAERLYGFTYEDGHEFFTIDTNSWQRNVLTQPETSRPSDIHVLNTNSLYMLYSGGFYYQPSLTRFNPETLEETTLSNHINGGGQLLIFPTKLQVDEEYERAFVTTISGQLFVIDLISGDRAILAQ